MTTQPETPWPDGDLTAVFDRHARAVHNHAFRLTGSWSVAEDVTSATFLTAWRRRADIHLVDGSPLPWLLVTASHHARTEQRTLRRWRNRLLRAPTDDTVADPADDVAGRLDDETRMREVLAAVRRLPRAEREAVALCLWSGVPYAEAATVLGVTESSVRSRVSRARSRLSRQLTAPAGLPSGSPAVAGTDPPSSPGAPGIRPPGSLASGHTATGSPATGHFASGSPATDHPVTDHPVTDPPVTGYPATGNLPDGIASAGTTPCPGATTGNFPDGTASAATTPAHSTATSPPARAASTAIAPVHSTPTDLSGGTAPAATGSNHGGVTSDMPGVTSDMPGVTSAGAGRPAVAGIPASGSHAGMPASGSRAGRLSAVRAGASGRTSWEKK